MRLTATEPILGQRLEIDADMVCVAAASVPPKSSRPLSRLLKVPLNEDGFFMEAHMKLRPVDFATDGIFMCGTAHNPKFIDESIAQAQAAASRAMTILARRGAQGRRSCQYREAGQVHRVRTLLECLPVPGYFGG